MIRVLLQTAFAHVGAWQDPPRRTSRSTYDCAEEEGEGEGEEDEAEGERERDPHSDDDTLLGMHRHTSPFAKVPSWMAASL